MMQIFSRKKKDKPSEPEPVEPQAGSPRAASSHIARAAPSEPHPAPSSSTPPGGGERGAGAPPPDPAGAVTPPAVPAPAAAAAVVAAAAALAAPGGPPAGLSSPPDVGSPLPVADGDDGPPESKSPSGSHRVHNPTVAAAGGASGDLSEQLEKLHLGGGEHKNAQGKKQAISYAAERVIGNGSFGVVYQAVVIETGETVAIKKVLQDRRFKNRELQIMSMLDHPDVVTLRHCFYSKGDKADEVYLNLVMEYIPETIHRTVRNHIKVRRLVPITYTKVYMYQICRSLAYIHSLGICHIDIKPQNLLLDTNSHRVKLCDFGSAKALAKGQPNVAYICSRYYRAPELIFEATEYTTKIDIWSMGCVMAELLLGNPLFAGENNVDQLIEIIKVMGTPTKEEIKAMNPNHTSFKFPQIKAHPWSKVFRNKAPASAIDLVSKFLKYKPHDRLDPFEALAHPFFDELRDPNARLPNGRPLPPIFNFTDDELRRMVKLNLTKRLVPAHAMKTLQDRIPKKVDD